ncbi:hypothetical protein NCLIV_033610 [Neospora caninum Liverpool]|uniref:Rab-GAP TBC domain-containing protein n=1 Tax=Neospora caninum (strain Liverpool) TaxID=572307 RepID=F0VIL3_NEOCL|nr:hypothetical protein NCLIV_033610 [Neospora caninum Liverpool]CBZ53574.1 hypothetical protein NCLIV_033610 [Neospora caninum Liverpool]|eukprot:XP_003883606.1 hypothetical protein NCLIV_033610 [Neospora caninum Liverpool]
MNMEQAWRGGGGQPESRSNSSQNLSEEGRVWLVENQHEGEENRRGEGGAGPSSQLFENPNVPGRPPACLRSLNSHDAPGFSVSSVAACPWSEVIEAPPSTSATLSPSSPSPAFSSASSAVTSSSASFSSFPTARSSVSQVPRASQRFAVPLDAAAGRALHSTFPESSFPSSLLVGDAAACSASLLNSESPVSASSHLAAHPSPLHAPSPSCHAKISSQQSSSAFPGSGVPGDASSRRRGREADDGNPQGAHRSCVASFHIPAPETTEAPGMPSVRREAEIPALEKTQEKREAVTHSLVVGDPAGHAEESKAREEMRRQACEERHQEAKDRERGGNGQERQTERSEAERKSDESLIDFVEKVGASSRDETQKAKGFHCRDERGECPSFPELEKRWTEEQHYCDFSDAQTRREDEELSAKERNPRAAADVEPDAGKGAEENKEGASFGETAPRGSPPLTGEETLAALQKHVHHLLAREAGATVRTRLASCADALRDAPLDLGKLRRLCAAGMPDLCPAIRAMYWRILLGYLSLDPSRWQDDIDRKRSAYQSYKEDFIKEPELVRRLRQTGPSRTKVERNASVLSSLGRSVASQAPPSPAPDPLSSAPRDPKIAGDGEASSPSSPEVSVVSSTSSPSSLPSLSSRPSSLSSAPSLSSSASTKHVQSLLAALVAAPPAEEGLQTNPSLDSDAQERTPLFGEALDSLPPTRPASASSPLCPAKHSSSSLFADTASPPAVHSSSASSCASLPSCLARSSPPLFPEQDEASRPSVASSRAVPRAERCMQASHSQASPSPPAVSILQGRQLVTRPLNLEVVKDHPLSQQTSSEWRSYWDDADIFDQINKDVFRTRPELAFFNYDPALSLQHQHERLVRAVQTPSGHRRAAATLACESADTEEEPIPLLVDYETLMLQKAASQRVRTVSESSVSSGASSARHATKSGGFSLRNAFRSRKHNASPGDPVQPRSPSSLYGFAPPHGLPSSFASPGQADGLAGDVDSLHVSPCGASALPSGLREASPRSAAKHAFSLSPRSLSLSPSRGKSHSLQCATTYLSRDNVRGRCASPRRTPATSSSKLGHRPSSPLVRFFTSGIVSPRRSRRSGPGGSPRRQRPPTDEDVPLLEGLQESAWRSPPEAEERRASSNLVENREGGRGGGDETAEGSPARHAEAKEGETKRDETGRGPRPSDNWPPEQDPFSILTAGKGAHSPEGKKGETEDVGAAFTPDRRAGKTARAGDLPTFNLAESDRTSAKVLQPKRQDQLSGQEGQRPGIRTHPPLEASVSGDAPSTDSVSTTRTRASSTSFPSSFSSLASQEVHGHALEVGPGHERDAQQVASSSPLPSRSWRLGSLPRHPVEAQEGAKRGGETPETARALAEGIREKPETSPGEDTRWGTDGSTVRAGDALFPAITTLSAAPGLASQPEFDKPSDGIIVSDGGRRVNSQKMPFVVSGEICESERASAAAPAPGLGGEGPVDSERRETLDCPPQEEGPVREDRKKRPSGASADVACLRAPHGASLPSSSSESGPHALSNDGADSHPEEIVPLLQPCRAPAGMQDTCDLLEPRRHYDLLGRVLFVYAKVNPGIRYVQGMNELLAPIYYVIMSDPLCTDPLQARQDKRDLKGMRPAKPLHAEAEIFFCFTELMQEQRDAFCKALDPTDNGVSGRISRLSSLLKKKEFQLPDVLVLWDAFIADDGWPLPLLYYVCVAMIRWLRPALLAGDFTACMKLLQHLPAFDPQVLLGAAVRMREEDIAAGHGAVSADVPSSSAGRPPWLNGLERLDPLRTRAQLHAFPSSRLQVSPLFGRLKNAGNALSAFASPPALPGPPSSSLLSRFANGLVGTREGGSVAPVEPNDRGRGRGVSQAKPEDEPECEAETAEIGGDSREVATRSCVPPKNPETEEKPTSTIANTPLSGTARTGSGNLHALVAFEEARHERQLAGRTMPSSPSLRAGGLERGDQETERGREGVGRGGRSLLRERGEADRENEERDRKEREQERRRREEERRRQVIGSLPGTFMTGGKAKAEGKNSSVAATSFEREEEGKRYEEGSETRREREDRFNSRSLFPWRRSEEPGERDRDFEGTLSSLGEKLGELRSFAVKSFVADTARALWAAGTGSGENFNQGREKGTEGERD